jgi:hypothetical protein
MRLATDGALVAVNRSTKLKNCLFFPTIKYNTVVVQTSGMEAKFCKVWLIMVRKIDSFCEGIIL